MRGAISTIILTSALVLSPLASAQTRDMDLGGAIMPVEDDDRESVEERAANYVEPDTVEALPVEHRPTPKVEEDDYIPFLWERARAYHQKGIYLKACEDFDALAGAGEDLSGEKAVVGRTYLACARLRVERKEVEQAIALLERAQGFIGEVPEMSRVHGAVARQRSDAALAKGDLAEAIKQFELAREIDPDATDSLKFAADLAYRARAAYEQGDEETTRQALEGSLRFFPDGRDANELKRELWLGANLPILFMIVFLALVAVAILWVLLKRARANQFEKAALRDDLPEYTPEEIEEMKRDLEED